jgi:uncharacterized protein (DUF885 family)
MYFRLQRRIFTFFLMIILCFSGCFPSKTDTTQKDFKAYTKDVFQDMAASDTLTLHYTLANPESYGISSKTITFGDFRPSSFSSNRKRLTKYLDTLKLFTYDELSSTEKETYLTLKDYLETQLTLSKMPYLASILSPTSGVQSQLPISLCEYSFQRKKDIDIYLSLLSKVPSYFDSVLSYEKEQLKHGCFMSDTTLQKVLVQIRRFTKNKKNNILLTSFSSRVKKLSWMTPAMRRSYTAKNRDLVLGKVFPAYRSLAANLERYKGLGVNSKGLSYYKQGRSYYTALVRSLTGTKDSVSVLIQRTVDDLNTIKQSLMFLGRKDPSGFLSYEKAVTKFDPKISPKNILMQLKNDTKASYPAPLNSHISIKYVDSSMEKEASPAFYMVPTIDSYKENTIYINNAYFTEPLQLFSTLAHEGYPGHLYQTTYFYHKKKNLIRYVLNFPGYCEGWATYVENQSYSFLDFGKHTATIRKLLTYNNSLSLALSSRIDLGVNYEGWNLKQVQKFLKTYHIRDKKIGTRLYQEVIENPGNYLSYYIGFLEFKRLKVRYKKVMGKQYQEKSFHKLILDTGPTSFSVLEKCINRQKH